MATNRDRPVARAVITLADGRKKTIEVVGRPGWSDFFRIYDGAGRWKKIIRTQSPLFLSSGLDVRNGTRQDLADFAVRTFGRQPGAAVRIQILRPRLYARYLATAPTELPGWRSSPIVWRDPAMIKRDRPIWLPPEYTTLERRRQLLSEPRGRS